MLPILLLACTGTSTATSSNPEPTAERSVIRDTPLEDEVSSSAGPKEGLTLTLPSTPSTETAPIASTPRPPTPVTMRNDELATESAGSTLVEAPSTAVIRSLSPETRVAELSPDYCGAMTLSDQDLRGDCQGELLRAGVAGGREFLGLLVFDLSGLPAADELLYAGLELTTIDDDFADPGGRWILRAVDLPQRSLHYAASFSQVLSLPDLKPAMAWRIETGDAAPGEMLSLDMDAAGLETLAARMGSGRMAFRIEGASRPNSESNYLSWHAQGEAAPLLRIAYVQPEAGER